MFSKLLSEARKCRSESAVPEVSQKCPRSVSEVSKKCPINVPEASQKCRQSARGRGEGREGARHEHGTRLPCYWGTLKVFVLLSFAQKTKYATAAVAQLAARRSHNPKVGSSILSCRICNVLKTALNSLKTARCVASSLSGAAGLLTRFFSKAAYHAVSTAQAANAKRSSGNSINIVQRAVCGQISLEEIGGRGRNLRASFAILPQMQLSKTLRLALVACTNYQTEPGPRRRE